MCVVSAICLIVKRLSRGNVCAEDLRRESGWIAGLLGLHAATQREPALVCDRRLRHQPRRHHDRALPEGRTSHLEQDEADQVGRLRVGGDPMGIQLRLQYGLGVYDTTFNSRFVFIMQMQTEMFIAYIRNHVRNRIKHEAVDFVILKKIKPWRLRQVTQA